MSPKKWINSSTREYYFFRALFWSILFSKILVQFEGRVLIKTLRYIQGGQDYFFPERNDCNSKSKMSKTSIGFCWIWSNSLIFTLITDLVEVDEFYGLFLKKFQKRNYTSSANSKILNCFNCFRDLTRFGRNYVFMNGNVLPIALIH